MTTERKAVDCPICMAGTQPNPYDDGLPSCTCELAGPDEGRREEVRDKLEAAIKSARGGDVPTKFKGYA